MKALVAATLFLLGAAPAFAHPCGDDALDRARPLLKFHVEDPQAEIYLDDEARVLAPIRSLKGRGEFDVLEVWARIYKADYRLRFIYARIPGSCILMGQEVLEASNPY